MGCASSSQEPNERTAMLKTNSKIYIQYASDDMKVDSRNPPAIIPMRGFKVELGGTVSDDVNGLHLEQEEKHMYFYKTHFLNSDHWNFIGGTAADPCIVSVHNFANKEKRYKVVIAKEEYFGTLPASTPASKKHLLSQLKKHHPEIRHLNLKLSLHPGLPRELVHMEERFVVKNYKIGVVYCKGGQTDETHMFSNEHGSEHFERFLRLLGDKIELKGWTGYRAELDVETDTTGTHSVFTQFAGHNIMFHVSTYLPYSPVNSQQLERKSRIGNDVCVIVFQDDPTPFSPNCISSKYNHVYFVVQRIGNDYKLAVASKPGVKPFGPHIKSDGTYPHSLEFRDFLLTKIINGERASYGAPSFNQARTRREWMRGIISKIDGFE